MAKRNADALAEFELLEACRFGGDPGRVRELLSRNEYEIVAIERALITLRAGADSVSNAGKHTNMAESALMRRLTAIRKRVVR